MMGALATTPTYAADYRGDWGILDDGYIMLGHERNGTERLLSGTPLYCGVPGDRYAVMNQVLDRNGNGMIDWSVEERCSDYRGNFARVCVLNRRGEGACSTYRDHGWRKYP
jgi:hypothetical protein